MPSHLYSSNSNTGLDSSIRGLCATPTAPLPFLSGVVVRYFILEREQGNIIIYNSPGIDAAARDILESGRPDRLLINHHHEAMYEAPDLEVPIFVHERDCVQRRLPIAGTFSKREKITEDLEVIPAPGHTPGRVRSRRGSGQYIQQRGRRMNRGSVGESFSIGGTGAASRLREVHGGCRAGSQSRRVWRQARRDTRRVGRTHEGWYSRSCSHRNEIARRNDLFATLARHRLVRLPQMDARGLRQFPEAAYQYPRCGVHFRGSTSGPNCSDTTFRSAGGSTRETPLEPLAGARSIPSAGEHNAPSGPANEVEIRAVGGDITARRWSLPPGEPWWRFWSRWRRSTP